MLTYSDINLEASREALEKIRKLLKESDVPPESQPAAGAASAGEECAGEAAEAAGIAQHDMSAAITPNMAEEKRAGARGADAPGGANMKTDSACTGITDAAESVGADSVNGGADTETEIDEDCDLTEAQFDDLKEQRFRETHSTLTWAVHRQLRTEPVFHYLTLPRDATFHNTEFHSRSRCEKARQKCITDAYDTACRYFRPGNDQCICNPTVDRYAATIDRCFLPILEPLGALCRVSGRSAVFERLNTLVSNRRENLLRLFRAELDNNRDYYTLYDLNYFIDRTEITVQDYRAFDEPFYRTLETLFGDNIEYSFEGAFEAYSEMEDDINRYAATFSRAAQLEYDRYIIDLENLVECMGKVLDPLNEDEDLVDYLWNQYRKKAPAPMGESQR